MLALELSLHPAATKVVLAEMSEEALPTDADPRDPRHALQFELKDLVLHLSGEFDQPQFPWPQRLRFF